MGIVGIQLGGGGERRRRKWENVWRGGGGYFLCFQSLLVVFHDPDGR